MDNQTVTVYTIVTLIVVALLMVWDSFSNDFDLKCKYKQVINIQGKQAKSYTCRIPDNTFCKTKEMITMSCLQFRGDGK